MTVPASGRAKGNERASKVNQGEVALGAQLPADAQCAKVVVPAVGAFDDPASSTAVVGTDRYFTFREELGSDSILAYAPPTQVWLDSATTDFVLGVRPVVSLVEAEILGTAWSTRGSERNCIESRFHAPLVVRIGPAQGDSDGHAASVGEDVSFGAKLRAISRIGSCKPPPLGALMEALSREAQAHSMPRSSS